jgi:hypothetical protein
MIRDWLVWLKTQAGLGQGELAMSLSDRFESSLNLWALVEGTHVLTLMLFFGTIVLVDLRMLGLAFRDVPFRRFGARVLPLTMGGFALLALTGAALFFAKPLGYYHNIFFRVKLALILAALLNLAGFHYWLRRRPGTAEEIPPPLRMRFAGAASLALWILVIACGRYIPATWFECGKPLPRLMNALEDCAASDFGAREAALLRAGLREKG